MSRSRAHPRSRGHCAGASPARMAARFRRFERGVRSRAQKIAYDWDQVDSSIVGAVDEFLRALDKLEESVKGSIEWLREPMEDVD